MPHNVDRALPVKFFADRQDLLVTSIFRTIQGEGVFAGRVAIFIRLAGCNYGDKHAHCQFCFPEDHSIFTPSGKTKFKDLQVGDSLFALDEDGKVVTTEIRKKITRAVPEEKILRLTFDVNGRKRKLTCTEDHPIHTSNRGFVPAKDLRFSDRVVHTKSRELWSEYMRLANPMDNPHTVHAAKATFATRHALGTYDLSRSDEAKERYRKSKLGAKNPMKRHEVRLANALAHDYPKSGLESAFDALFASVGVKAKYVGDKQNLFPIGDTVSGYRFPDFLLGKNKVVEVYNTQFKYQVGSRRVKRTKRTYENATRRFYESFGYEVLFLTQKDLPSYGVGKGNKATDADLRAFKDKVISFKRNGAKLIAKEPLITSSRRIIKEDGCVDVVNFSCHPYNTFIVNDIHTHNCDTSFQVDNASPMSVESVAARVQELAAGRAGLVVITGGEPTLQPKLVELAEVLNYHDYYVQLETNGTRPQVLSALVEEGLAFLCVSPKAHITKGYSKLDPGLQYAVRKSMYGSYKFVITADPSDTHHTIPDWALAEAASQEVTVLVSPMTVYRKAPEGEISSIWDTTLVDQEATAANYLYAAQYVLEHPNLQLTFQSHLFTAVP